MSEKSDFESSVRDANLLNAVDAPSELLVAEIGAAQVHPAETRFCFGIFIVLP